MLKLVVSFGLMILFLYQENEAPKVELISPQPNAALRWSTPVRYEIGVADKEDGDSKYNEIDATQVMVQAIITSDTSTPNKRETEPLRAMMASNCMNCHAFDAKLIGPSFKQIGERYANTVQFDDLVKHVREGSRGIWGDVVMPTHPELTPEETSRMVKWIIDFGNDDSVYYATGTEGMLRLKKPENNKGNTYVVITASYRDKGGKLGEGRGVVSVSGER